MNKSNLFMLCLLIQCTLYARDYFVAVAGLDNATRNGDITSPFATMQYALDKCAPGDSIQVRGGTYFQKLNWSKQGTFSRFITLKNYNNEVVVIDGTGQSDLSIITVGDISYIQIEGLTLQNNYRNDARGIAYIGTGKNVTIKNCVLKNIGWTNIASAIPTLNEHQAHAIIIDGKTVPGIDTVKIIGCSIHDIITGFSEAITIAGNVDVFEIDKDTVYNTKNIAIDIAGHKSWSVESGVVDSLSQSRNGIVSNCVVYDNRRNTIDQAASGIYVDGGRSIKLLNNKSYQNGNGISIGCEIEGYSTSNVVVMNNQVYNNDSVGLVIGSDKPTSTVKNSIIINNTFFKNGSKQFFSSEIILQNSDSNYIVNNLIVPGTDSHYGVAIFFYTTTHLTVDRNLIYRYSGNPTDLYVQNPPGQFVPTNMVTGAPGLVNTTLPFPDLYISNTSGAINMGSNSYPVITDVDAGLNYRLVNGTIDVGAFERQDGGCPSVFTINDTHMLRGKFAASQNLIVSRSQLATVTTALLWSSPMVTLNSPVTVLASIAVKTQGCN